MKSRRKGTKTPVPRRGVQRGVQGNAPKAVALPFPGVGTGPPEGAQADPVLSTPGDPGHDTEAEAPTTDPNRSPRPHGPDGRFVKGHPGPALQHRLYSDAELPPALAAEDARFMAGQYQDEGEDPAHVPTRRASLLHYRGQVHRNINKLTLALDERGLIDKRGKLRVAWLQMLLALMDRAIRLDSLLGLERTPRQLPQSPRAWLEALAEVPAQPITHSDGPDESIGESNE